MDINYTINTKKKTIKIYGSVKIVDLMSLFNKLSNLITDLDAYEATFVELTPPTTVERKRIGEPGVKLHVGHPLDLLSI